MTRNPDGIDRTPSQYIYEEDFTYHVNGWKITNRIPELRLGAIERAFQYDTMRTVVFYLAFIPEVSGTYFNLDVNCTIICPGCGKKFKFLTDLNSRCYGSEFVTCTFCNYRFDLIMKAPTNVNEDCTQERDTIWVLVYSYIFAPQTIDTIHMPYVKVKTIAWNGKEEKNVIVKSDVSQQLLNPSNKKWWKFWK